MKIVAIVAEYNPFHKGHEYQINKIKEELKATHIIAIMSSSFNQRGNPSIVDKWTKAKIACLNGVDLVLELPVLCACGNAEFFAKGAIKILNSLNVVDYLTFGVEDDNLEELYKISKIIIDQDHKTNNLLKKHLANGHSFLKARQLCIENLYKKPIGNLLNSPNNILAIEYLKALSKSNSNIKPYAIKRSYVNHNSNNIEGNFASSTYVRALLKNFTCTKNIIMNLVPNITYRQLESYYAKENRFSNYNDFFNLIKYKLLMENDFTKYTDFEIGLNNRLLKYLDNNIQDIDTYIDLVHSKRYTKSRISRLLNNILLEISKEDVSAFLNSDSSYIRVLASNNNGFSLINRIRESSTFPVYEKFSKTKEVLDASVIKLIEKEILATNIYNLNYNQPINCDFKNLIIIK